MPLEFAHPDGLWLLSLLPPLVLLHFLRGRRSRRIVPSLLLWKSARAELSAQRPFRKLLPRLSLLLQVLALVTLALASSHPTRRVSRLTGEHVGVVIDIGLTMQTVDIGTGLRFEQARARLRSLIATLSAGSDMFFVAAGSNPTQLCAPLSDRVRLSALADSLTPEDSAPDLGAAIAQATQRLRRLPGSRTLAIISDSAINPADIASTGVDVSVWRLDAQQENARVRVLDVRRTRSAPTAPERLEVLARVSNQGAAPCSRTLALRQLNSPNLLDSRQLRLQPGEEASAVLSFEPAATDSGAALVVELTPGDALAADDRAYVRVPDPERLTAAIVPPGSSRWLERAIAADGNVDLFSLDSLDHAPELPLDAVTFSVGRCPLVPIPGDLVVMNPPPGTCLGIRVGAELAPSAITSWNLDDRRLRFVSLDDVTITKGRVLGLGPDSAPLVQSMRGPVVADASTASGAITVLGFDPEASNWPLKASFVIFVRNILETARGSRVASRATGYEVGRSIRLRVPADVQSAVWTRPDGSVESLIVRGGTVIVPTTKRAGHYHVAWKGQRAGSLVVPVNLGFAPRTRTPPRHEAGTDGPGIALDAAQHPANSEAVVADYGSWLAAAALLFALLDLIWLSRSRRQPDRLLVPFAVERRHP